MMHVATLGKSGSRKNSLLKYMSQQDVEADRGFVYFDLHGDATSPCGQLPPVSASKLDDPDGHIVRGN
jgi:hypothetical protein